jgi:hypothetical protein
MHWKIMSRKKWISTGLALVALALIVAAAGFFAITPGRIDR